MYRYLKKKNLLFKTLLLVGICMQGENYENISVIRLSRRKYYHKLFFLLTTLKIFELSIIFKKCFKRFLFYISSFMTFRKKTKIYICFWHILRILKFQNNTFTSQKIYIIELRKKHLCKKQFNKE